MRQTLAFVCSTVALLAACASPPLQTAVPPFQPVADMRLLMEAVIDPAADTIWESVGTIVTMEGTEELEPRTDEEWTAVRNAAVVVTESGNLLMLDGRARDTADWITFSQALVEIGTRAIAAAEAQDTNAIFEVGGHIYNVCAGCHQQYIPSMDDDAAE